MVKKLAILFIGYLIALAGTISCVEPCGPFQSKYKVTAITPSNNTASFAVSNNPRLLLSSVFGDSVKFYEYGILLTINAVTYAKIEGRHSQGLISSAFACDPPPLTTVETIQNITVTTTNEYNAAHTADSDVSDLFDVIYFDKSTGFHERLGIAAFIATQPLNQSDLTLIPNTGPDVKGVHSFKIKFYQDGIDVDYFEMTTREVLLLK